MPKCSSKTKTGKRCQRPVQKVGDVCPCHKNTCSICMEMIESDNRTLSCGHQFHKTCINKWEEEGHNTCPCCRTQFKKKQFSALITLYPRNSSGTATIIPMPTDIISTFLRSLNIAEAEIDSTGDNINLEFDDNEDLIDFFDEVGMDITSNLRDIA